MHGNEDKNGPALPWAFLSLLRRNCFENGDPKRHSPCIRGPSSEEIVAAIDRWNLGRDAEIHGGRAKWKFRLHLVAQKSKYLDNGIG